jgi:ferrous-iron efflux pump FieF
MIHKIHARAAKDLLDATLPSEEEESIRRRILHHRPVICGFHQLRARKSCHFRLVEFHLKVDPEMSVQISHAITEDLSLEQFPSKSVMIHRALRWGL